MFDLTVDGEETATRKRGCHLATGTAEYAAAPSEATLRLLIDKSKALPATANLVKPVRMHEIE